MSAPTLERPTRTEPEPTPVAGVLDLRSTNPKPNPNANPNKHGNGRRPAPAGGTLRTSARESYLPSRQDLRVPPELIRRHRLRPGDTLNGTTTDGRTLATVELINHLPPAASAARPAFADLTPLHPHRRLRLETAPDRLTTRAIDLLTPLGKGQRGLIVAPPKTGKTVILQQLAQAISTNHPECRLLVVLLDERPEEVTDFRRRVDPSAEVLASTFDHPAEQHTALAELAVERAKRLAETGTDVVILLDSLTRLCRAYNTQAPAGGKTLSGGVDAHAVLGPKRFFGAARETEEAGSITILASALVDTGSRGDDYWFEELKSTGNMELRLDRLLADRRVHPALDIAASGTRREELLTTPDELAAIHRLRRALAGQNPQQAGELLVEHLRRTGSNAELLLQVTRTTPA
ncbi:transcription termination factor Rho [Phaeacidiphilus oryzae]|uniref:transcription termination factor Rho n=1 Tax=Phaeacidiphilus oryzae TaxID=348818 RepID=UPI00055B64FC|nr:transcription termination factor Rho [Phaeacidiphilus oryzae]